MKRYDVEPSGTDDERALEVLRATAQALARCGRIGAVEFAELLRVAKLLSLPAEAVAQVASEVGEGEAGQTLAPAISPPAGEAPHPHAAMPEDAKRASGSKENHFGPEVADGLPRYVLIHELGRGGMGVVWKAWQTDLPRYVAIKFLESERPGGAARLAREAQAAAGFTHPCAVAVYEAGEVGGRHFIAMQFIDGGPIHRTRFPLPRLLEAMRGAADAVHHMHGHGVIHRDLKPANILIDRSGKAFVADFGLARLTTAGPGATLTFSGQILGTPNYMSPEQAQGVNQVVGRRSDVWGLGATLYEVSTGVPPFQAPTLEEILHRVIREDPIPPRSIQHLIPRDLETIILRCLEKQPSRRYASAAEVAAELERVLRGDPILARRPRLHERVGRAAQRHPGLVASVAVILLAGLAIGASRWIERAATEKRRSVLREEMAGLSGGAETERWRQLAESLRQVDPEAEEAGEAERQVRLQEEAERHRTDAIALLHRGHEAMGRAAQSREHGDPAQSELHLRRAEIYFAMAAGTTALTSEARNGLAASLSQEAAAARERGDAALAAELQRLGQRLGSSAESARLLVRSDPPGARVRIVPIRSRIEEESPVAGGTTNFEGELREEGLFLLELRSEGYLPIRLPIQALAGELLEFDLPLVPEDRFPSDLVYVPGPGGRVLLFARAPVGVDEFNNYRIACGMAGYTRDPAWVSREDALAYCSWLGARLGLALRPPSEEEWRDALRASRPDGQPRGPLVIPSPTGELPNGILLSSRNDEWVYSIAGYHVLKSDGCFRRVYGTNGATFRYVIEWTP